jgi:hypothetical protein
MSAIVSINFLVKSEESMFFVVALPSKTRDSIFWTLTHVTTNNYDSLTVLHTPKITITTAHIKSSQSSVAVAR